MSVDIGFANVLLYLLVFARLAGMLLFNPLLARNGVPPRARMGLVLFMALLLGPLQPAAAFGAVYAMGNITLVFSVLFELAVGFAYGYIFQVFYYLLIFIGDAIDTDIGFSMAKSLDPATNIQTGVSAGILTSLFCMYIFVTGSHLALFKLFAGSFTAIPIGTFTLSNGILSFMLQLFAQVFALALRLAAPFMVAEFALQFGMGILMKFIPQITVFVVNFQLRIILGIIMLLLFGAYIGDFISGYIDVLFQSLVKAAGIMAGA